MLARPAIRAAVLAAGGSVRFRPGPKALPPPKGADLLNLSVKSLALLGLDRPLAAVNPGQPEVIELAAELGCAIAVNPNPELGMFSSVRLVLERTEGQATVVLPVDAGLVSADSILSAISHFLGLEGREDLAVLPAHEESLGHPPVIGPGLIRKILLWDGAGGLRGALAAEAGAGEEARAVLAAKLPRAEGPAPGSALRYLPLDDPMVLADVDTREDLRRLEEIKASAAFRPSPSPGKALTLLALAGPERKTEHCLAVGVAALRLALAIGSESSSLAFICGVLHDIRHGTPRHAWEAGELIEKLGWTEAAIGVRSHTELDGPLRRAIGLADDRPGPGPSELPSGLVEVCLCVHLADKYIKGPHLVDLETRFSPDWANDSPEVQDIIARRLQDAMRLDRWFEERLKAPVATVLRTPSLHHLESLANSAAGGPAGPR
jgi:CTP:molybdopterin cytidylyltransferase MocA